MFVLLCISLLNLIVQLPTLCAVCLYDFVLIRSTFVFNLNDGIAFVIWVFCLCVVFHVAVCADCVFERVWILRFNDGYDWFAERARCKLQIGVVPAGAANRRRCGHRLQQFAGAQLADVHVHAHAERRRRRTVVQTGEIQALHRVDGQMVRFEAACVCVFEWIAMVSNRMTWIRTVWMRRMGYKMNINHTLLSNLLWDNLCTIRMQNDWTTRWNILQWISNIVLNMNSNWFRSRTTCICSP